VISARPRTPRAAPRPPRAAAHANNPVTRRRPPQAHTDLPALLGSLVEGVARPGGGAGAPGLVDAAAAAAAPPEVLVVLLGSEVRRARVRLMASRVGCGAARHAELRSMQTAQACGALWRVAMHDARGRRACECAGEGPGR
jgi:hypothetical protein